MANPSVTHTFTNSTTADATQVNQNFTDLINSLTDGTKSLSIDAITCAGAATFNGAVNLGNATSDDITVTGYIASDIIPKTTEAYDLGSTTLGWAELYLADNSQYVKIVASSSASASWTLTLPPSAGTAGDQLVNDGSGTLVWKPGHVETAAKTAAYVITDTDKVRTVLVTTGASDRDVTLPTASDNMHRIVTVKKVDSGAAKVTLKSDAAGETIDGVSGTTGIALPSQYDSITVQCDGSDWHVLDEFIRIEAMYKISAATANAALASGGVEVIDFDTKVTDTHSAVTTGANWVFTAPRTRTYRISATVELSGATAAAITNAFNTSVYDPGGPTELWRIGKFAYATTAGNLTAVTNGTVHVRLAAGSTIDIRSVQNTGGAVNISTNGVRTHVSIEALP